MTTHRIDPPSSGVPVVTKCCGKTPDQVPAGDSLTWGSNANCGRVEAVFEKAHAPTENIEDLVVWLRQGSPFDSETWGQYQDQLDYAADALTAVSAERDSFKRQAEHFAMRGNIAQSERDRLHKAITEALAVNETSWRRADVRRILRAALEN